MRRLALSPIGGCASDPQGPHGVVHVVRLGSWLAGRPDDLVASQGHLGIRGYFVEHGWALRRGVTDIALVRVSRAKTHWPGAGALI